MRFMQEVEGHLWVSDYDCGATPGPNGYQRTIHVGPLLELVPRLLKGKIPFVSNEWNGQRTGRPNVVQERVKIPSIRREEHKADRNRTMTYMIA